MGCHKKNMFKTIARECDLKSLTEAIVSQNLEEAIATTPDITVFGPTDKAFRNFTPSATCGDLTQILLYHVVNQYLPVKKLKKNGKGDNREAKYDTLREGKKVRVNVYSCPTFNDVITVNGVRVVEADIYASNGVLHKIKKVLCPPSGTIADIASKNPDFSILVEALKAAGLVDALNKQDDNLTVFAPTNAAFARLLAEFGITKEQLLSSPKLKDVLLYHVLGQTVFSVAIKDGKTRGIPTLEGETLDLIRKCEKQKLYVKDQECRMAKVIGADILAENGVIHAIDKVLLPFSL